MTAIVINLSTILLTERERVTEGTISFTPTETSASRLFEDEECSDIASKKKKNGTNWFSLRFHHVTTAV